MTSEVFSGKCRSCFNRFVYKRKRVYCTARCIDTEMKMRRRVFCIAGITHQPNCITFLYGLPLLYQLFIKVGIIKMDILVCCSYPNGFSANTTFTYTDYKTIGCCNRRRKFRCKNINALMAALTGIPGIAPETSSLCLATCNRETQGWSY